MPLPLIDFFADGARTVYTSHEMGFSKGRIDWIPSNPVIVGDYYELAELPFRFDNVADWFVEDMLTTKVLRPWRNPMGSSVPPPLGQYQKKYANTANVDSVIKSIGALLSPGQKLFRGGTTNPGVQSGVLSTTFSPEVAMNEALWNGKANAIGKIQIYVLEVVDPKTCVYVFRQHGSNLGHEKEVLFASGAFVSVGAVVKCGTSVCGLPYEIISATIS